MRNLKYLPVIVLFITSCNTIPKDYILVNSKSITKSLDTTCIELFDDIVKEWAAYKYETKEESCYYYNSKLITKMLDIKKCFIGMKLSDIQELLGKPSLIGTRTIWYEISKECKDGYNYNDDFYSLRFTAIAANDTIFDVDLRQKVWLLNR